MWRDGRWSQCCFRVEWVWGRRRWDEELKRLKRRRIEKPSWNYKKVHFFLSLFFNWGFGFVNECSWLLRCGKDSALGVTTRVTNFTVVKNKNTLGLVGTCVASHFHFCNVLWLLISFILYALDLDQTVLRAFTELNWSAPEG